MIKRTLKHFGAIGLMLLATLAVAPSAAHAQDGYWGRRDYGRYQNRYDNRYDRHRWRQEREWRRWDRNRDWRRQAWRNDRWNRRYPRNYYPGNSFYFGYRY